MERIEPDTEHHRTQKAIRLLVGRPDVQGEILFPEARVAIEVAPEIAALPGGQLALALTLNLLARMQSIVGHVCVPLPRGIRRHPQVPLQGDDLRLGLEHLVGSVAGAGVRFPVAFSFDDREERPVVRLMLGHGREAEGDRRVTVQADAWTAYVNAPHAQSDWRTTIPFGPNLAACLGVAEIFKWLLHHNFPQRSDRPLQFLQDATFSTLTYGGWSGQDDYPEVPNPAQLQNVAIAGLGAGGSTVVYTLGCLPGLAGDITLIEPGRHKRSNLARYLLSTHEDCARGTSKVQLAHDYLHGRHPGLCIRPDAHSYADVADRDFGLVVSTVDTPEARWDIQRDHPPLILDAAVLETIYALLRVEPGEGMCLGCKHPYDPDVTWKRRAAMWGKTLEEVRELDRTQTPVRPADLVRLAETQGRPEADFQDLLSLPFDKVPQLTECGDSHFNLRVPNQAATLPFVTATAGVLLAAELVKERHAPDWALRNWFAHDLLWRPKPDRHRFRRRTSDCHLHPR